MKVCFSGTFNVLHKGHKTLIAKALQTAGKNGMVYIGVTKGKISQKKKFNIPLETRMKTLQKYLEDIGCDNRVAIQSISDKYGPAEYGNYDAIIVSPETYQNAKDINQKRKNMGKKPLKIIKTQYVLAKDKKPISSTRILNNEIDENGNPL